MHKVLGGGERRLVGETAICEWLNKTVIVYSAHKVLGGGKRRLVGETAICEWLNKTVIVYSAHKVLGGGKRLYLLDTEPILLGVFWMIHNKRTGRMACAGAVSTFVYTRGELAAISFVFFREMMVRFFPPPGSSGGPTLPARVHFAYCRGFLK